MSLYPAGLATIVVTSIFFFAAHVWHRAIHHLIGGLVLGATYYVYNDLIVVIVMHLLWNFLIYVVEHVKHDLQRL